MLTVVLRASATPSAPALLLRPWTDADIEPLVEVYRDPMLRRWTRLPVQSSADAVRWLDVQRDDWANRQRISFAVLEDHPETGSGRLVGNVVLKTPDLASGCAEVGYWTAAYARGRGVATRALEALTGWALGVFAAEGLDRLALLHQVDNHASCRVAEKAGYRFERIMPARPPYPRDGHQHIRRAQPRGQVRTGSEE